MNWVNIAGIRDYFTQLIQPKHQDHRNKYELSHKLTNNCQTNQYRVINIFINSGKPTKHKSVNCWFISKHNNSLLLCPLNGESLEKLFLYYRNTSMYSESNNNREITSDNYKKNNNNNNNKNSKAQPKKSNSQGKAMEVDNNPIAALIKVLNQLGINPAVLNSALANKQKEPIKEPVPPAPPYDPDGSGGSRKRQILEVAVSNSNGTTTTTISSQVNPWNINKRVLQKQWFQKRNHHQSKTTQSVWVVKEVVIPMRTMSSPRTSRGVGRCVRRPHAAQSQSEPPIAPAEGYPVQYLGPW